jgi:osmotically-inducible protein OsmY
MHASNDELAAAVRARVIHALGPHSAADAARIVVVVRDGCAVLRGCVPSWTEHEALERAALSTPGITRVDNQLALLVKAHLAESHVATPS